MTNNKYLQPFKAFIPNITTAMSNKTIAPLYDTVSSSEARELAIDNPFSFLHVTKAEIDFDNPVPYNNPKVYDRARENLELFIRNQVFTQLDKPAYFIYKTRAMNHTQVGLIACCMVDAIRDNYIKSHELTREAKETDRVKNILAVNASISPVMFVHKNSSAITELLESLTNRLPNIIAEDNLTIEHSIYIIDNPKEIEQIATAYSQLENLYVADGHHRTHAALRVGDELKNNNSAQQFMMVAFPEEQLNILGYHRIVSDLNGYLPDEFLHKIYEFFDITPSQDAVLPNKKHTFGMYLNNRWYKLNLRSDLLARYDSISSVQNIVEGLDCSILNELILYSLLGIGDITKDSRVDFFGGSKSYRDFEKAINKFDCGVGFTLAPTTTQDLFEVADNNLLMPPKSTWFYPKLCDGLFFYKFD